VSAKWRWGRFKSAIFDQYLAMSQQVSPLPLTDPRDAEAQRMVNIPYRIMW